MGRQLGRPRLHTTARLGISELAALVLAGAALGCAGMRAQRPAASTATLVFDQVTVIDVEHGTLLPRQRVVIAGNHIQAVGSVGAVELPKGARVVDARGKYLIPGLWDMHTHAGRATDVFYPLLLANGVTGFRDAWSDVPLDTLHLWRREILAGVRVGPPRQLLSGPALDNCDKPRRPGQGHICVTDTADARHVVDSLKAAGADCIKMYRLQRSTYFAVAAEAHRVGLPIGGHLFDPRLSATEASDSGARIIDHPSSNGGLDTLCTERGATVERCRPVAEQFRRNNTWFVPTWVPFTGTYSGNNPYTRRISDEFNVWVNNFWSHSAPTGSSSVNGMRLPRFGDQSGNAPDSVRLLSVVQRTGLPTVAGTDVTAKHMNKVPPGFALHEELAMYVAEGLTPLAALQTATLNPTKMLGATDSLGTVAAGKLADLVLLDANPLADITNTTLVRAVVANGRYFDRAALDQLLEAGRARADGK